MGSFNRIANEYGPNQVPWTPAPIQESEYTPARQITLGQDGTVEFRKNIARVDGTYHRSPATPGVNGLYVESW